MLKGIGVSGGVAIGKTYIFGEQTEIYSSKRNIKKSDFGKEVDRFKKALSQSVEQLSDVKKRASLHNVLSEHIFIIDTHIMILQDDTFIDAIIKDIRETNITAEWAIKKFLERFSKKFNEIGDEYLKGKKTDIEHISNRILSNLTGYVKQKLSDIEDGVIIVSHDISPCDIIQMDKSKVLGIATNLGGRTSHTSILASAMGIPAVVGLKEITSRVANGDTIILDGDSGQVILRPGKDKIKKHFSRKKGFQHDYEEELFSLKDFPCKTKDGYHVKLMANLANSNDSDRVINLGADGIGLYRTEVLFMNKSRLPSEEELFSDYKRLAGKSGGKPVIIRTVDIGGDNLMHPPDFKDINPALGLRGVRWCLKNIKMFKLQLKAILKASFFGDIRIMYPMISGLDELDLIDNIYKEVSDELLSKGIPFKNDIKRGAMIEIPSAAVIADLIAKRVDFFSIGTNDLIQYSIAVDRGNEEVAYLYQPYHPAIIRLLNGVITAANKEKIDVGVCGEMGADPSAILLLLGMGDIDLFSMDIHAMGRAKRFIRSINIKDAANLTKRCLSISSASEIKGILSSYVAECEG